jgi:hypothetical protein
LGKRRWSSQICQQTQRAPLLREGPYELVVVEVPAALFKKKPDEETKGKESKERMKCRGGEGKIIRCMGL